MQRQLIEDILKYLDKFEKKLAKIELEEKLYSRATMELVAKARMREISTWSKAWARKFAQRHAGPEYTIKFVYAGDSVDCFGNVTGN